MRRSATVRQREIVDVAIQMAGVAGAGALSTTALARSIGISQPAIFRHFPTKAALWEGIADTLAEEMVARWQPALTLALPAAARLRALAEAQLGFIALRPAVLDIVFSRQLHHENPALKGLFQRLMTRLMAQVEALVTEAAPKLAPGRARDLALILGGTIQATALRWSLNDKGFDLVTEGLRLIDLQIAQLDRGGF